MTAYAKSEERTNELVADVEIRTYNSRHLDFNIRVPHGYNPVEEKIKELVSSKITRGRVELKLFVKDESEGSYNFDINSQKASAYCTALKTIAGENNLTGEIPVSLLSGVSGVITPSDVEIDFDKQWVVIEKCIIKALSSIIEMRKTEGDYLKKDFQERLDFIESALGKIEKGSLNLIEIYQKRLTDRIKKLTDGIVEIDEARIAQEAAMIADRSDISEEIVRAKSHVQQFNDIMNSKEAGGRKLNFLLQEFNREFNTIGSKTGNAEVAHFVVDVKAELEKMREQIQNVE